MQLVNTLKQLLNILSESNISLTSSPLKKQGIAYEFNCISHDKIKGQYAFKLIIADKDLLTAYTIQEKIHQVLLTMGDQSNGMILSCEVNGSGYYYDDALKMYRVTTTYLVTTKG